MEAYVRDLFDPAATHVPLRQGRRLTYTVLRHGRRVDAAITLGPFPLGTLGQRAWGVTTFAVVFELLALYIFLRRPRERLAAPLLVSASCMIPVTVAAYGLQVSGILAGSGFWLYTAGYIGVYDLFLASLLHAALLFPVPHPIALKRRWVVPLLYAAPFVVNLLYISWTRLHAVTLVAWLGTWQPGERVLAFVYEALVVVVIVSTYLLHREAETRQKIRWVILGSVVAAGGTVLLWFVPELLLGHSLAHGNVLGLLQTAFPVALAIAILRYRRFDIDVIINRTLVYGSLTASLAAMYFVIVVVLGALGRQLTGQAGQQPVVIVISTLVIAALFQPLRRRIQWAIDRRFYRRRYDAARTLEAFSATLRQQVDLGELRERLVGVVQETMQPEHVSLWLRGPNNRPS
jgi:hypothetical protein